MRKLAQEVAGQDTALTATCGGIACHGVDEDAHPRRRPGIGLLGEDAGDGAGEHIAGAGGGHPGITPLA